MGMTKEGGIVLSKRRLVSLAKMVPFLLLVIGAIALPTVIWIIMSPS